MKHAKQQQSIEARKKPAAANSSDNQQHVGKHCPWRGEPLSDAAATQKKEPNCTKLTRDMHSPRAQLLDGGGCTT